MAITYFVADRREKYMIPLPPITSYLESHLSEYLDKLSALVNVDCGTGNKPGVDQVGRLFRSYLREAGFELLDYPLDQYGDCCLASLYGRGKARLMLLGHLDTVYPPGTVAERPMRFEGGHILGPGACDMKAGLLSGYFAVRALLQAGFQDFARIDFYLNTDEEVGSPASHLIYQPVVALADAALVLESARRNGDVVSARKGDGVYHIHVQGRQAHAGVEIERGANAIMELVDLLQTVAALHAKQPGRTVNVGVIGGGILPNIVPDQAWADVDVRFITAEDGLAVDRIIRQAAEKPAIPGTQVSITGGIEKNPMEKTPASAYLVQLLHGVGDQLGIGFTDVQTGGTSDGNFASEIGVPTIDGLGPIGGFDHSPEEFLDQASIVPRTTMLAGLIAEIAAHRAELLQRKQNS